MKITVIFEDNVVIVDGEAADLQPGAIAASDPNHRAIQWMGDHGWIEVYQGDRIWLGADDEDLLDPYLEKHNIRMEEKDAAEASRQLALAEVFAKQREAEKREADRQKEEEAEEALAAKEKADKPVD